MLSVKAEYLSGRSGSQCWNGSSITQASSRVLMSTSFIAHHWVSIMSIHNNDEPLARLSDRARPFSTWVQFSHCPSARDRLTQLPWRPRASSLRWGHQGFPEDPFILWLRTAFMDFDRPPSIATSWVFLEAPGLPALQKVQRPQTPAGSVTTSTWHHHASQSSIRKASVARAVSWWYWTYVFSDNMWIKISCRRLHLIHFFPFSSLSVSYFGFPLAFLKGTKMGPSSSFQVKASKIILFHRAFGLLNRTRFISQAWADYPCRRSDGHHFCYCFQIKGGAAFRKLYQVGMDLYLLKVAGSFEVLTNSSKMEFGMAA